MALFLQVAPRFFSTHFRALVLHSLRTTHTLESFVASVLCSDSATEAVSATGMASFFLRLGRAPAKKFSVFYF
jgi:hypothetical protein